MSTENTEIKNDVKNPQKMRRKKEKTEAKKDPKAELRKKLKEKRLARSSYFALDARMEKIENLIDNTKNKKKREKLKEELDLLEKVEEQQLNRVDGDPAEYGDNCGYGGGMVMCD